MNAFLKTVFSTLLPMLVIIAAVAGCAEIRKLTYPENFTYIEDKEVESMMHRMGDNVGQLMVLLADASPSDTVRQQEIVAKLDDMEKIALRLSGGHQQTNQFVISEHIEEFLSDIGTAKTFARIEPPKYYKARDLTNSCQECHQFR